MSERKLCRSIRALNAKLDDGRSVEIHLLDNGGFMIEWRRPDEDPSSAAEHTTSIALTPESFAATVQVGAELIRRLAGDEGGEASQDPDHISDETWQDKIDADRYRTWRDGACYRTVEFAKALAPCITPDQIDQAVDRLR